MLVSGSIGVIILSMKINLNKEKIIIILSDDHASNNYCSVIDDKSSSLSNFFNSLKNKQVLIEEIPENINKENIQIEGIWNNIPHVQELKDYFLKNSKEADGVDIRLELVPFSIELLAFKKELLNFKFKEYIKELKIFFEGKGKIFNKYFYPLTQSDMKNLIIDNNQKEIIKRYFTKLLTDLKSIEKKSSDFIYPNNDPTIMDFHKKDILFSINLFKDIDDLINSIMEFYVILKLFSTEKVSIIHMGLFHTSNISRRLMIDYQFKILYKNGVTDINYANDSNISCIKLPNLSKFGID